MLGQLTPLPIPVSGHLLHPVVGLAASRPRFLLAAAEVERLIEAPLSQLRRAGHGPVEAARSGSARLAAMMDVPYFDVDGAHVWGATAMVLAELLAVLAEVDAETPA